MTLYKCGNPEFAKTFTPTAINITVTTIEYHCPITLSTAPVKQLEPVEPITKIVTKEPVCPFCHQKTFSEVVEQPQPQTDTLQLFTAEEAIQKQKEGWRYLHKDLIFAKSIWLVAPKTEPQSISKIIDQDILNRIESEKTPEDKQAA